MTDRPRHTPGPWRWNYRHGSLHQAGTPPYAYGATVLTADYEYDVGVETKVSDADRALIAAAPDLLDALKALVLTLKARPDMAQLMGFQEHREMQAAEAAIAKAEGEVEL